MSTAEAEFLGNLTLSGNTVVLSSNNVTIEDRIFGVAANNSAVGLDSGFMIEPKRVTHLNTPMLVLFTMRTNTGFP